MKKIWMLSLLLVSALANAKGDFTPWEFFSGATPRGTQVCGLGTASKGREVQNVAVKLLGGSDSLNVTMFKDSWRIPTGTSIPVSVDFSDDDPLRTAAFGDGKVVDLQLPKDATAILLLGLGAQAPMRLTFLKGNEPAWEVPAGIPKAKMQQFIACVKKLPTRPY